MALLRQGRGLTASLGQAEQLLDRMDLSTELARLQAIGFGEAAVASPGRR